MVSDTFVLAPVSPFISTVASSAPAPNAPTSALAAAVAAMAAMRQRQFSGDADETSSQRRWAELPTRWLSPPALGGAPLPLDAPLWRSSL